jgi:hypothetical protein
VSKKFGVVYQAEHVSPQIKTSRRWNNLTWSHHAEVSAEEPTEQNKG